MHSGIQATQSAGKKPSTRPLRLAAIDLDGTLLAPDQRISPENLQALQSLQQAGLEVVIATGRHYHSMKPFADQVPGLRWVVTAQGAEVSDLSRRQLLRARFLPKAEQQRLLGLSQEFGLSSLLYAQDAIHTGTCNQADLDFYEELSGCRPVRASQAELLELQAYKAVWVGKPSEISQLNGHHKLAGIPLQMMQTWDTLFEFMPADVDKGSGLEVLAKHLGLSAEEVVVFGDAENDIPMFDWAGIAVAMPHGWPAALARASLIGPDAPRETALAEAIRLLRKDCRL